MRIASVIERRLLVNYRVEPGVLAGQLPEPLRPRLVGDWAVAGVCLVTMAAVRPGGVPSWVGVRSENAAHRYAVEWDSPAGPRNGMYIPRRDTSSRLNVAAGGRLFPGEYHHARFDVRESGPDMRISYASDDGTTSVSVDAEVTDELRDSVLFTAVDESSDFFRCGSTALSRSSDGEHFDAVELDVPRWRVLPVRLRAAGSSLLDDADRFPSGSAVPDSALLMRDAPATWRAVRHVSVSTPLAA